MKFSDVIKDAKGKGFTEPDPRDDLSGTDVARKVLLLLLVVLVCDRSRSVLRSTYYGSTYQPQPGDDPRAPVRYRDRVGRCARRLPLTRLPPTLTLTLTLTLTPTPTPTPTLTLTLALTLTLTPTPTLTLAPSPGPGHTRAPT